MTALQGFSLVLNRSWVPVAVATVRQALTLMCKGSAHAVHTETYQLFDLESWANVAGEEGNEHVQTVSLSIPVPEVIVLANYDACPEAKVVFPRRNLYRRDRYTCQYCGEKPGVVELTIDHVFPRSRGGRTTWENCVLACRPCNCKKADRTPAEARMPLRAEPEKPTGSPFLTIPLGKRRLSWKRFVSEAYWNAPLDE